jgi:assimilatory nitrate reductase catalytic subunit
VATLETRRGHASFVVEIAGGMRDDTAFAPFHWGGEGAVNRLTNPALDPMSRMPEFKVCAARIVRERRPEEDG